jgi:hypothetical protein
MRKRAYSAIDPPLSGEGLARSPHRRYARAEALEQVKYTNVLPVA